VTRPAPAVFVGPAPEEELTAAVLAAGCRLASEMTEADGLVWYGRDPAELQGRLPRGLRWLQLPDAGVEKWVQAGFLVQNYVVTSARGVYGPQVAEHALAVMLACVHGIPQFSRARVWEPAAATVSSLRTSTIVVVGAGGIGSALIELLKPFGSRVIAINRSGVPVEGAVKTYAYIDIDEVLPEADVLVLSAPSTAETRRLLNKRSLALMKRSAVVVNVARGDLIDTDALVDALDSGGISMAALDVTDPEPLPKGHPILSHPRALITPHVANPPYMKRRAFALRVLDNCTRFADGRPLVAVVDPNKGY
jgi:phosphoglycerate dehydrogenase-like enzyme